MTHPIIQRRRAEQRQKIELAARYLDSVMSRLVVERAWVVGSVARGDFNVWSDIDVVILVTGLPEHALPRADLFLDKPSGVNIVAYTPEEFERELKRGNPLAVEASAVGFPIGPSIKSSGKTTKQSD